MVRCYLPPSEGFFNFPGVKEHEAFIQYVDEQVAAKLAEIDVALEKGKLSPVVGDTIPYSTGMA